MWIQHPLNRFLLLKPKKSKKLVGQAGVCNVYVVHAKRVSKGCVQVRNREPIVHSPGFSGCGQRICAWQRLGGGESTKGGGRKHEN
ncbi:hypothetical protein UFOVP352_46 [uncultured Caudovirales phage]|uniref:Uncharacterized protein n=1 Tax=uncultured Caudovirales phage TaxID=2100421 RepID=A0A6J5LYL6_9CAUD|nr:hypothetical protein UFOVP352_46 [uncultured Caudovirales phage]CAB4218366.1 hypothetical protein UFOVP1607_16 [uncultured Caudovirales phage]